MCFPVGYGVVTLHSLYWKRKWQHPFEVFLEILLQLYKDLLHELVLLWNGRRSCYTWKETSLPVTVPAADSDDGASE